jgi:hypothetical protein
MMIKLKKGKSQVRRILQNIIQERKELSKEILWNIYQENERVVILKIFCIIICS